MRNKRIRNFVNKITLRKPFRVAKNSEMPLVFKENEATQLEITKNYDFDELRTNKLETSIKILKKFEKASRIKLSKNIFSKLFELLRIIAIVSKIINELKLKIKLKLSFIKTPIIKIENIDKVKKISGSNIFRLFIILV